MKKKLSDFIPNTASTKSVYTMVKFGKRKDLLTHMVKRVGELKTSKNAYILALIEQDQEITLSESTPQRSKKNE